MPFDLANFSDFCVLAYAVESFWWKLTGNSNIMRSSDHEKLKNNFTKLQCSKSNFIQSLDKFDPDMDSLKKS